MAVALALGGCGDKNPHAVYSPEGGHKFIPDWNQTHKTSAKSNLDGCIECHGEDLLGGISAVSCEKCHPGGPTSKHPVNWGAYTYARHAATYNAEIAANPAKPTSCATAVCHGTALTGFATAPNCATACHLGGTDKKHPAGWTTLSSHKTYLNGISNVSTTCKTSVCHGTDGKGVFLSGPACDQCHTMK